MSIPSLSLSLASPASTSSLSLLANQADPTTGRTEDETKKKKTSAYDTKIWKILFDEDSSTESLYEQVEQAATLLAKNEAVAIPTETVYGLAANAYSDEAVRKIYEAKDRPSDNPLIVHIANETQLQELVGPSIGQKERMLINAFWPGPLTIIFPIHKQISKLVTAGNSTVGVRMPSHPVARAIIEKCGLPLAAPSANKSSRPSPTCAQHVLDDLNGRIIGIVDGGKTDVGVESTVISCLPNVSDIPVILRPGGITKEEIEAVIGPVKDHVSKVSNEKPGYSNASNDEKKEPGNNPLAPGMKYAHYAPKAQVDIVEGSREFLQSLINKAKSEKASLRVGVLASEESSPFYTADVVISCGRRSDTASVARTLFDSLRQFDLIQPPVDVIFSESFDNRGIGAAVMNRLIKAAGNRIQRQ